ASQKCDCSRAQIVLSVFPSKGTGYFMKICPLAAVAALGVMLSGCATIINGTTQSMSVASTPEQGAQCTLVNSEGTWYLTTPGTTTVHKTKNDLNVTCTKPGFQPGHMVAVSHFGAMTAANIVGGLAAPVYATIDAASGANYHYDSPITVALGPPSAAQAAAASGIPTAAPTIPVITAPSPAPSAPANPAGK
ncbi:MAG TPA: hypothetical protein VHQ92_18545, partial [Pseudolabrys sp.]|nr:hypothetical protein [Pseudolabrys sp.]